MSESVLLADYPTVTVGETDYPMRPLGIRDVQAFTKILRGVMAKGQEEAAQLLKGEQDEQAIVAAVLISGVSAMFDDVVRFLASLLEVPVKEFEDPRKFPLGAHAQVIGGLLEHPDLEAFLSNLKASAGKMGRVAGLFSSAPSTSSSGATAGATSKS